MDTARDTSGALPRIGQRTTKQRTAVVAALGELTSFTSAQDIHSALTADGRNVGLT
ncbi:MAG: transcriptional repressor, partial [Corynebacterium variabile]